MKCLYIYVVLALLIQFSLAKKSSKYCKINGATIKKSQYKECKKVSKKCAEAPNDDECVKLNALCKDVWGTSENPVTIPDVGKEIVNISANFTSTWASSQYSAKGNMPPVDLEGYSYRQIIRTSIAGKELRFHFSNLLGESELELVSVHVAKSASQGSGEIISETDTEITFNGGESSVKIPAYKEIVSDVIAFDAPPLSELAITIFYGKVPETVTSHVNSRTNTFIEAGNVVSKKQFSKDITILHWYTISAVDVVSSGKEVACVCLGDSITDGRGVIFDANNRWTDIFAEKLQKYPETQHVGVLNHGIGATEVIGAEFDPMIPSAESRFEKDVIEQVNAKYLIIFYGVNDVLFSGRTTEELIAAYRKLIERAHKTGITVYGATILPFHLNSNYTEEKEKVRAELNEWILNTPASEGGFDGGIDFSKAVEDPSDPIALNREWNYEDDGLHPNHIGYAAIGNAVDVSLFTKTSEYLYDKAIKA
ncbi:SGNH hydrolase [Neocallimastix californiae]|jgi:lysophospholipase L1-like esterase|uniref:SGNH hydrolase n=1 Tax=Neocallimastix californiae TaxID=1754190 RepID=A0A1Y2AFN6_9FUNG|nr:SGNH hydrolase [Neocallimastix californiae]|eukprot:ORY21413.1 SGNH hydrolase [Neocallimastix californiae]